jgi:hypothetical protein
MSEELCAMDCVRFMLLGLSRSVPDPASASRRAASSSSMPSGSELMTADATEREVRG